MNNTKKYINEDYSLEQIAVKMGETPAVVARYIQIAIESGENIKTGNLFDDALIKEVKSIMSRKPNARLSQIRAEIESNIDYPTLRIAVTIASQGKK